MHNTFKLKRKCPICGNNEGENIPCINEGS